MKGIAISVSPAVNPAIQKMLQKIRNNHIDIIPIIEEELNQILLQYIEEIVKNVYNKIVEVR